MHEDVSSERSKGFIDRAPGVYANADNSDGFDSRSIRDYNTWLHSWGAIITPVCYACAGDDKRLATTLSLWQDLESVAAFAYHGPHAEALTKRRDWFPDHQLPVYVAWWVPADAAITWPEGAGRLDHLHTHGSTPHAFTFSKPFDPRRNSVRLDAATVKLKAERNATGHSSNAASPPASAD
jgi:hypothetical protein